MPEIIIDIEKDITAVVWLLKEPKTNQVAVANVKIGPITINGFKILAHSHYENDYGGMWVDAPSYRNKKGENAKLAWIGNPQLWDAIKRIVLEKYKETIDTSDDHLDVIKKSVSYDEIPIIEENK